MNSDHGGLGPPMVTHDLKTTNTAPRSTNIKQSEDFDELMRQFRKSLHELDECLQRNDDTLKERLERTLSNTNAAPNCLGEHIDSIIDSSTTCCIKTSENETQQKPPAGAKTSTTKEPPSNTEKSRLIVSSSKFPDPKNCPNFSKIATREEAPCWFHKKSGRAVSTNMTKHEAFDQGPSRPYKFHPGALLPTTQFFARTLGATCSAKHYHAFRRPPPARDKNQARRVPRTQAMHNNDYFKMPRRATKFKPTHFKVTRGATLRKEHYQAFRKPPPTRDRKQDWIKKHHE